MSADKGGVSEVGSCNSIPFSMDILFPDPISQLSILDNFIKKKTLAVANVAPSGLPDVPRGLANVARAHEPGAIAFRGLSGS